MRKAILAAALAVAGTFAAGSALAADAAPAAAPAPAYSTSATNLGTLLDNPATRAVLEKHMPQMISNPQIEMARGFTLKVLQGFAPDGLTDELLAKIDADLAQIPAAR